VGDERAQPEVVSACESFAIMSLGLRERDPVALGSDLAQKPLDLSLAAALTVFPAKRPRRAGRSVFAAAGVEIGLSQREQRERIEATRRLAGGNGRFEVSLRRGSARRASPPLVCATASPSLARIVS
jgi:hypothetical protein